MGTAYRGEKRYVFTGGALARNESRPLVAHVRAGNCWTGRSRTSQSAQIITKRVIFSFFRFFTLSSQRSVNLHSDHCIAPRASPSFSVHHAVHLPQQFSTVKLVNSPRPSSIQGRHSSVLPNLYLPPFLTFSFSQHFAMAFVTALPTASATRAPFAGKAVTTSAAAATAPTRRAATVTMAAAAGDVPDMGKRNTMNLLLTGTTGVVVAGAGLPFALFFVPKKSGGGNAGVTALDALGNPIVKANYLKTNPAGSRALVQGLKGDATWMIVNDAGDDLEYYALNAVCTHLGCVVPWDRSANKFKCPCHGSQYSKTGAVVRGPAPLPLALERVEEDAAGNVVLKSWGKNEDDFRTGEKPWWNF